MGEEIEVAKLALRAGRRAHCLSAVGIGQRSRGSHDRGGAFGVGDGARHGILRAGQSTCNC